MWKTISLLCSLCVCTSSYLYTTSSTVSAQVTSDGTVNTQVTTDGNVDEITGGETRGDNLFHSFQDFSVPTNNEAFFNNANDIANIFSRVTGGNISNIDGLIRANGSANLFLINPAGILFGENASLDIGGSFYGSTADSILFEEGEYSATDLNSPPLLTINAPIGLNLRDNPAEIINRSVVQNNAEVTVGLEVSPGNNLTLVGGEINLEGGSLTATGGRIELGGLSQAGTIALNDDGSLNFPTDVARADVTLSNAALVGVRGTGRGDVAINVRNLKLEAGELGGSVIGTRISEDSTEPEAQAGNITINATDNVTVDRSLIVNRVDSGAVGDGGDVTITTDTLSLTNGGRAAALTVGRGNAGSIEIAANDSITIDGADSQRNPSSVGSQVASEAVSSGGDVTIITDTLSLTNGGTVNASTLGQGSAGSVEIIATDSIVVDGADSQENPSGVASQVAPEAVGSGGDITVTTDTLSITNGGRVDAGTLGQGNAGSVEITATDNIAIDGEGSQGNSSFVGSQVAPEAVGSGGDVTITTDTLSVTNGGAVSASTGGRGNGGSIEITADDNIAIDGEGSQGNLSSVSSVVAPEAEGDGGDVTIITDALSLTDRGGVGVGAAGQGNAGSVNIEADSISLDGDAGISSASSSGSGGIVNLSVASTLTLNNDSSISARAFEEADGGNLSIDAEFIVAFADGSNDIIAAAEQGQGGNITINAESVLGIQERPLSGTTNDINASSSVSGLDGTVDITTTDINPTEGATELPSNIVAPQQTTEQACAANREAEAKNGLNIVGKGGVPPAPELPLNSLNTITNGETNSASTIPAPIETSRGKIQPARGIEVTPSGTVKLTAYPTNNQGERLPEIKPNCGI